MDRRAPIARDDAVVFVSQSGETADTLAAACQTAEASDKAAAPPLLDRVRDALEIALADVAAYRHALMLRSLRG